uniref:Uncharacterized protein n=1 Tax=Felis catus TaxID=9685 RepID=A0ABI7ZA78_FELCA
KQPPARRTSLAPLSVVILFIRHIWVARGQRLQLWAERRTGIGNVCRCPPGPGATGKYAIRVVTRDSLLAGSRNLVQLWLVGEQGEADLGKKLWPVRSETEFEVSVPVHLGRLLLAKLRKILLDDAWFCERISARPGTQGEARFPCYRRVRGDQVVCLPEGTARTLSDDHQDFLKAQREQELQERKKVYRWGSRKDGPILPVAGRTQCDLPRNQRFLEDKDFDFRAGGLGLEGSLDLTHPVKRPEDFKRASPRAGTPLAETEYKQGKGRENRRHRIRSRLQARAVSTEPNAGLEPKNLKAGSLSEADFSLPDGVKPNVVLRQQGVAAPLVMLTLQPDRDSCPPSPSESFTDTDLL